MLIGLFASLVLSTLPRPTIDLLIPETVPVNVGLLVGALLPNSDITFVPATVRVPAAVRFAVLMFAVESNDTVRYAFPPAVVSTFNGEVAWMPLKFVELSSNSLTEFAGMSLNTKFVLLIAQRCCNSCAKISARPKCIA